MTKLQLEDNTNYISPEMFQSIIDYCHKLPLYTCLPLDVQMIFKIAYHGGLRVNEVLNLRKKNIHFDVLEIELGKTKTEERGLASIPPGFVDELKEYLKGKDDVELLFPVSRQTAYKWLMKIGEALNIAALTTPQTETHEKTKTHIFRKSIGKDMLYKKAPLNIIQRKLRHNNINTTSEYLKIKLNDVKNWESDNL